MKRGRSQPDEENQRSFEHISKLLPSLEIVQLQKQLAKAYFSTLSKHLHTAL